MCTVSLCLCVDGRRVGCAFVQYSSVFDASHAIKHMNGQNIQGNETTFVYILVHV